MVPIHDTDVASESFEREKWRNFELWEKIEVRERKKRRLWIAATVCVFLMISAVPAWTERAPKWATLRSAQELAQELNTLKRLSVLKRKAHQIRFVSAGGLEFVIEEKSRCGDSAAVEIRRGRLGSRLLAQTWVAPDNASRLGIERVLDTFCYDPLKGHATALAGDRPVGFALIPVNDLTQGRADRISTVVLRGDSAEITFN